MDMAGLGGAGRSGPRGPVSDEMLVRTLYAEHAGPLLRYAFHLTSGDRQRAEDIVQETLLRAWLHPDAIAERPARPWLFAVARNLAVDRSEEHTSVLRSGDRQRAEDIVQETLLRAWLHPDAIAERPARPWLFAVARNLAVDAHRAR